MHVFDSNGPEVRIRGTAHQVYEKYLGLARDASGSGDRVASENLLQHAEHYYRIILAQNEAERQARGGFDQPQPGMPNQGQTQNAPASDGGFGDEGDNPFDQSIGFAGSPYTLACYMVEGAGSDDYRQVKSLMYSRPDLMHRILQVNADAVALYLNTQIEAGFVFSIPLPLWNKNKGNIEAEQARTKENEERVAQAIRGNCRRRPFMRRRSSEGSATRSGGQQAQGYLAASSLLADVALQRFSRSRQADSWAQAASITQP